MNGASTERGGTLPDAKRQHEVSGSRWFLRSLVWLVAFSLIAAACSTQPDDPVVLDLGGDTPFRIDVFVPGNCSFDVTSQVLKVAMESGAVIWTRDTPWSWNSAADVQESVVAMSVENGVVVMSTDTGAPQWQLILDPPWRATLAEDSIVEYLNLSRITSRDVDTGGELWQTDLSTTLPTRVSGGGPSLYLNEDGQIKSLDNETGVVEWAAQTEGDESFPPDYVNGSLFYSAFEGRLYRLEPATGEVLWTFTAPEGVAVLSQVKASGNAVLVTTVGWSGVERTFTPSPDAEQLVAIDVETGQPKWTVQLATNVEHANNPDYLLYANDTTALVHRTWTNVIDAIDTTDGSTRWTIDVQSESKHRMEVTSDSKTIYLATGRRNESGTASMQALDTESGTVVWKTALGQASIGALALLDENLFVAAAFVDQARDLGREPGGSVTKLTPATGERIWEIETLDPASRLYPAPGDSLIVVASDAGTGCD